MTASTTLGDTGGSIGERSGDVLHTLYGTVDIDAVSKQTSKDLSPGYSTRR